MTELRRSILYYGILLVLLGVAYELKELASVSYLTARVYVTALVILFVTAMIIRFLIRPAPPLPTDKSLSKEDALVSIARKALRSRGTRSN